jgi:hypothetical protein
MANNTEVLIARRGDRVDIVVTAGGQQYCFHNLKTDMDRVIWDGDHAKIIQEFLVTGGEDADSNGDLFKRSAGTDNSPTG